MRLKSNIWVAAYLRRCQTEGVFGAVRRRGAEEAGAVFVKVSLLDGNAMLYVPAPQTVYDDGRPVDRFFVPTCAAADAGASGRGAPHQGNPLRSGRLDRRDRGPRRPALSRIWRRPSGRDPSVPVRTAGRGARLHARPRLAGARTRALAFARHAATDWYLARVTASVEPRQAASITSAERSLSRS